MTPRPEVKEPAAGGQCEEPLAGHEVVISGISGKFPESDSVRDFMRNLYDKVDMVSDDNHRWKLDHPDIPNSTGKIDGVGKFDAQFFGVHHKQAMSMDPMGHMLLEHVYGAITDAGINPRSMRNSKTGVYVGMATTDAEKNWFYKKEQFTGFELTGTARTMLANRISFWLGARGPSYTLHAECSSTLLAMEHAYNAIHSGQCDAAIVAGCNICLHPFISLHFCRLGLLSQDGRTKCFDRRATGYGRADAIGVILLQRAKYAIRAYAQVVHAKSNYGGSGGGGVGGGGGVVSQMRHADSEAQRAFLEDFYSELNVLPAQVQYIEAFGGGLPEVDKNELDAIDKVFCKGRQDPILVGCVKSNMGHAEAASGAAAVTKICLAYHKGEIAPNLHYQVPRNDVAGVREGRIRIVTEPTPFSGGYAAASSYSFTGVNVHILFKGIPKRRIERTSHSLPRLVTLSGRSEESLKTILKELESLPLNMEQIRLLHNIHEVPIPGHVFRAYSVLEMKEGETVSVAQHVDYFPGQKRPVWFVYSGMGSQWSGMGAQLMRIPVFAAAIERCCQTLAPKGVNLMHILTDPDPTIYDNILHSFVGISAVQIALTDVLTALGIKPDNIIGHSVGELVCAYADGCLTAEEVILSAYSRGLVSTETPFIRGSMAAVGIGYDQMKCLCPPEIEVACHNGPDSCTISGPADAMKRFVGELTSRGIFAKEVPCSNIAYHSRYIAEAGPRLLKYLREVIKDPKPRSPRWLSTSVPQSQWEQPSARLCSAEYHTNNLLRPVLFEETSRQIPPNAITIEVAPHGLLQAILRRSLSADCIHVPLTKRHHADNVHFLLDALGKLFMGGLEPKMSNIYPIVQFPVSAGTPVMSHFVSWEHNHNWTTKPYIVKEQIKSGERHFVMSTCDEEYKFITGHVIDGVNTFPAAGYLLLAWETLAMTLGTHYSKLSVVFEDIRFESDAVVRADDTLELVIMLQKATGNFEITSEGGIMASGRIYSVHNSNQQHRELEEMKDENDASEDMLSAEDVYKVLYFRGYSYNDEFRSIEAADISASKGHIKFNDNWVTFLDGILQMNILRRPSRGISKPKLILKLTINVVKHMSVISSRPNKIHNVDIKIHDLHNCARCGGVELEGLVMTELARRAPDPPLLEACNFLPTQPRLEVEEWGSYQYLPLPPVSVQREHAYLSSQQPEDISSLAWLEGPLTLDSAPSHPSKKLVQVYYSSVSHIDMRKASGRLQFENSKQQERSSGYGMDFCGRTSTGERVMALVRSGALSSLVEADVDMLWPVPPHWSMEDAATVPLAYANAFYCLAGIEPGMSVLIHSGSGALGQASISICLALGCEVFTTVSTLHKKQWLLRMFPRLKETNIGNSHSGDFEDMVMSATTEGCNFILNTLSRDLCTISMRCLSPMGTFITVNSDDFFNNSSFGLSFLKLGRTFKPAFVANLFLKSEGARRNRIQQLIANGIALGYVQPLSRVVLDASEAPRAFRFTSTGRHVGKVLLKLRDEELRPLVTPSRALLAAQPHFRCSKDDNYVVILDNMNSGLELADWLVQRGARSLMLHSPQIANSNGYHAFKVRRWRRRGVNIQFSAENLQTEVGCEKLLTYATKQTPVLGMFMTSRASQHGMFERTHSDQFAEDFMEKARVITNLDIVSRKLCPQLQQFVVWSSTAAGRGAADCSSGSLADCVVERVCEERGKLGLPALAVQCPLEALSIAAGLDQLLATEHNVVSVSARPLGETKISRNELLPEILIIIGVDSLSDLNDELKLEDYNVDRSTAREMQYLLQTKYRIFCTPDRIMKLSIQELRQLQCKDKEKEIQPNEMCEGLSVFFSSVDPEEFNAGEPLVRMPTLLSGEYLPEEEMYKRDTYLIFLSGMEGHKYTFSTITKRLKLNAFTCQLDLDHFDDSIQDMAIRMSQIIMNKLRPEGKFLLLGYSFGVTVALEVAAKLEEKGHVGQVFCLDGSPKWFMALLEAHLGHLSEQHLQNAVIEHMYRVILMSGGDSAGIADEALELLQRSLAAESDWERKLDICMRHLRGRVNFSFQYLRSLLAMAYACIQQARAYSDAALLSRPLRSELVLLKAMRRPRSLSAAAEALGRDLGLGAYSQQPVAIHELDCNHTAAPFDLSVSNIINARVVDLQQYGNLNLCDTYDMDMR